MVFSVYVFLDEKGKPYYVGKTNNMNRRRKEHLGEISNGNSLPKYQKARMLIRKGHKFIMKRVFKCGKEEEAYKKEYELIKLYRNAKGIKLTNLTSGGVHERPTDLKGRPRKASWYKPTKTKSKRKMRRRA